MAANIGARGYCGPAIFECTRRALNARPSESDPRVTAFIALRERPRRAPRFCRLQRFCRLAGFLSTHWVDPLSRESRFATRVRRQ